MLSHITLKNYRGFEEHSFDLRRETVIVGKNNAGKTTIVEAISLISVAIKRAGWVALQPPPSWLDIPMREKGFSPSIQGIEFEYRNLCHRYGPPPAIVEGTFDDGKAVRIYLHSEEERLFCTLFDEDEIIVIEPSAAKRFKKHKIFVLPPVGRLKTRESILNTDYVRTHLHSTLTPLHFRNQIFLFGNDEIELSADDEYGTTNSGTHFDAFSQLAEKTWPHLQVYNVTKEGEQLNLMVRDGPFVAEVAWVGHGLQAWLQTCWFLASCPKESTIVLDEPDVYLHADLQRKLLRIVKDHFSQIVIATHSVEILSEVNPENVLVVDKDGNESRFAETVPAVQSVINNIGGAHNLQFARLWSAKKCIFIEGEDIEFLNSYHKILFPSSFFSLGAIPGIPIGGYGNWTHAVGAAIGLRNAGGESIMAYCILDSDYHLKSDHEKMKKEAKRHSLNLHVWNKKEIENYVINPKTIYRFIQNNKRKGKISEDIVTKQIDDICEEMKEIVQDAISEEVSAKNKKGPTHANREARSIIKEYWGSFEGRTSVCPGKQIISELSKWSQNRYGVSFSALSLCREMRAEEIDIEIKKVVTAIEDSRAFNF